MPQPLVDVSGADSVASNASEPELESRQNEHRQTRIVSQRRREMGSSLAVDLICSLARALRGVRRYLTCGVHRTRRDWRPLYLPLLPGWLFARERIHRPSSTHDETDLESLVLRETVLTEALQNVRGSLGRWKMRNPRVGCQLWGPIKLMPPKTRAMWAASIRDLDGI